ncbi:MAG: hypothetical protein ACP5FL_08825 [Thermoplasmatota archaeon]
MGGIHSNKICTAVIGLYVVALFVAMSSPAQAYEDVIWEDYKGDIIELLDQYGENFAACFPELPADFPSSGNISTLGERINELDEAT